MEKKVKIYALKVPDPNNQCAKLPYKGFITEIDTSSPEEMQEFVGGYAESDKLTPGLSVICNEDGRRLKLQPNRALIHEGKVLTCFVGNIFVCREENLKMVDILEEDISFIEEHLLPIIGIHGGAVHIAPSDALPEYTE